MRTKEKLLYWFAIPLISALIPVLFGWQTLAKLNGWIPEEECPGKPIKLTITSPVDGLSLDYANYGEQKEFFSSFVVKASHPIAKDWYLGILSKSNNTPQYRLSFPSPDNKLTKTEHVWYRLKAYANDRAASVEVRAVLVDDYRRVGEHFSSVQQVINSDGVYSVSEPVIIKIGK